MAFRVKDAMTERVVTVSADTTVDEVCGLLLRHRVSGLPVVDDHGVPLGVISEYDLLDLAFDPSVESKRVGEFLAGEVITIGEDESLTAAAQLFLKHNVRRLLVSNDGILAGVLSRRDLVFYIRDLRGAARGAMHVMNKTLTFKTKKQIADHCGVSLTSIHSQMESGALPTRKQNGFYLLTNDELQRASSVRDRSEAESWRDPAVYATQAEGTMDFQSCFQLIVGG